MILGHEGVGVVLKIGPEVAHLHKGDRVGWGYLHDCCGHCELCQTDRGEYCACRKIYGEADFNKSNLSAYGVWKENCLLRIPDMFTDIEAITLMCAGSTVYNVLYRVANGSRVGIVGVNALGQLAIQFARKLGLEVTVFSRDPRKREQSLRLGADTFYKTGAKHLNVQEKINCLLVTTPVQPDWRIYTSVLERNAKIPPLAIYGGNLLFPCVPLLTAGIQIIGTSVTPRHIQNRMLQFATVYHIKPSINITTTSIEQTRAVDTLKREKNRNRGVIILKQIPEEEIPDLSLEE